MAFSRYLFLMMTEGFLLWLNTAVNFESFDPMTYPTTPDGRYFVVKGRLWRCTNPSLPEDERQQWVKQLMDARRQVKQAKKAEDEAALAAARSQVNTAKIALGERGPTWWDDGAPDYNRHMAKNTPYADWYAQV